MDETLKTILEVFKTNNPTKEIIFLFKAGSHFFDMNGPNSDVDYRGVYIDISHDCFSQTKKNKVYEFKTNDRGGKNSSLDTDFNLFSLSTFLKLLKEGDFNMMEMLYTPDDKIIISSPLFREIMDYRDNLIVRDASAFLGFAQREFKDCGMSDLHRFEMDEFCRFLARLPENSVLGDLPLEINSLIESCGSIRASKTFVENSGVMKEIKAVVVSGRLFQLTRKVGDVHRQVKEILDRDTRIKTTEISASFKTIYHAMRCSLEGIDLLTTGKLAIPFDADRKKLLLSVKHGEIDRETAVALTHKLIDDLVRLSEVSASNKNEVSARIDRIIFALKGRMEVTGLLHSQRVA